jgi:hypothetical protein
MIDRLRRWARSQDWYLALRRVQKFGLARSTRRWLREPGILRSAPVRTTPPDRAGPCEVHMLTHQGDWVMALWALKSFFHFSGADFPVYLHAGGDIPEAARAELHRHLPDAVFFGLKEADQVVEPVLAREGLATVAAVRREKLLFRKLVDVVTIGSAPNILLLDADVLFFAPPDELVRLARSRLDRLVFNRDFADWYAITPEQARERFGLTLPPAVNVGLGVVPRACVPLGVVDEWFRNGVPVDPVPDQTIYALLGARVGLEYLPPEYATITGRVDLARTPLISRHYCGFLRHLFFDEGIPHLRKLVPSLAGRTEAQR